MSSSSGKANYDKQKEQKHAMFHSTSIKRTTLKPMQTHRKASHLRLDVFYFVKEAMIKIAGTAAVGEIHRTTVINLLSRLV